MKDTEEEVYVCKWTAGISWTCWSVFYLSVCVCVYMNALDGCGCRKISHELNAG